MKMPAGVAVVVGFRRVSRSCVNIGSRMNGLESGSSDIGEYEFSVCCLNDSVFVTV